MEVFYPTLLVVSAFWLGACPFSVWIGQWLLGKDIRDYGDGNPGAAGAGVHWKKRLYSRESSVE